MQAIGMPDAAPVLSCPRLTVTNEKLVQAQDVFAPLEFGLPAGFGESAPSAGKEARCRVVLATNKRSFGAFAEKTLECNQARC